MTGKKGIETLGDLIDSMTTTLIATAMPLGIIGGLLNMSGDNKNEDVEALGKGFAKGILEHMDAKVEKFERMVEHTKNDHTFEKERLESRLTDKRREIEELVSELEKRNNAMDKLNSEIEKLKKKAKKKKK